MSNARLNRIFHATITAIATISAGVGTGVGAAIRNGSISNTAAMIESASIAGIGTGLVVAASGFFMKKENSFQTPSALRAIIEFALLDLAGTATGAGAKFFINSAASTAPFIDTTIGFPVTLGMLICLAKVSNYYLYDVINPMFIESPRP